MASIKNLYDQAVGEIFAYSELTDKVLVSHSDYANEVLGAQWVEDLEKEAEAKKATREVDTMDMRKQEAEIATDIKREDARKDLFLNQKSPFLFRKYMLEYWNRLTNEYLQSYPVLSDYQQSIIRRECSFEVQKIVHACGYYKEAEYDPHKEWIFEIPYDERPKGKNGNPVGVDTRYWVKAQFGGPCQSGQGYTRYCWDGTYYDDRNYAHAGNGDVDRQPFKINYTLPESWI